MMCSTPKPNQSVLPTAYKAKTFLFQKKELFQGKEKLKDWIKKGKESFVTALAMVIKKVPTTSTRKHANELKTEDSNYTRFKPRP